MRQGSKQRMSCGEHLPVGDGFQQRASRFFEMAAVVETALAQQGTKLWKGALDFSWREVRKTELLKPRRID